MRTKNDLSSEGAGKPEAVFTSGSIPRALLVFTGPYMLGILLQNLYGAVDLFVVGHYAATADVSAVTIGSQLMSIVTHLIIGLATGLTVLVGRCYGARDEEGLSRITGAAVALFAVAAVVLTALYLGCYRLLTAAMQTPEQAVAATESYLLACAVGIPFIVGYNVIAGILTGLGDAKTPFVFIAVACAINVVLDVALVKYVHLGALGAAVATTAAQAGSFVFAVCFLRRKGLGFPLSPGHLRFDRAQIGRIARIGAPVAVQNILVGASFLFVTAIINRMGLTASAAVGVVEKIVIFLMMPAIAMGAAVSTAAAQNIGAGRYDRAGESMWWGIRIALVPAVLITVFCQFGGDWLARILARDPGVVALAAEYLRSYSVDIVLVSFVFCMNGYFNSRGKSWFSLLHSLATTFAVRVPAAFFLSRLADTSLYLIGWSAPASTLASLALCLLFLSRQREEGLIPPAAGSAPQPRRETARRVVVTIGREYGSGGRLIGERVAERLGIAFYNRNLIDLTAQRSGLAEGYIAQWEEQISSRFIWSPVVSTRGPAAGQLRNYYSNEERMFATQSEVIRQVAERSCVIVGRCADYILRDHPDCVNVFIRADMGSRVARLVGEYGIDPDKAEETAAHTDRGRANYYNRYTNVRWGDGRHYHLLIDSGRFGIERAADLIVEGVYALYPELAAQGTEAGAAPA